MTRAHLSYNHHWIRRKIDIRGKTIFHRQCIACGRDFVIDGYTGGWRAVHVGLLDFDFLDEQTSQRWVSDECPGQQLPEEVNDRRIEPHNPHWKRAVLKEERASIKL